MNKYQIILSIENQLHKLNEDQLRALYLFLSKIIPSNKIPID